MFIKFLELLSNRRNKSKIDTRVSQKDALAILLRYIIHGLRGVLIHSQAPSKLNIFGKNVAILCKRRFKIGKHCIIGNNISISCLGTDGVVLGNSVSLGDYSKLVVSSDLTNLGHYIRIEDGVGIGEFSRVGGSGGVTIGRNTIIGQYFSCHPENHIFTDINKPIKQQGTVRAPIIIGEDCWVGAKVTILAGTNIGKHSVVAAGSVVSGNFPPFSVIGGIPAKIIKDIK